MVLKTFANSTCENFRTSSTGGSKKTHKETQVVDFNRFVFCTFLNPLIIKYF